MLTPRPDSVWDSDETFTEFLRVSVADSLLPWPKFGNLVGGKARKLKFVPYPAAQAIQNFHAMHDKNLSEYNSALVLL